MNMNMKMNGKILIVMSITLTTLTSCVMDTMPLGYRVKNCTKDTLFIDLTVSDTLTDDIYWGIHPEDTIGLVPEDTTSVYIHGEKVILYNFYYALPDSTSGGIYPLDKDTCYIYTIKKQIITSHTLDEIRVRKLYDRRAVTKKDFNKNRIYEYRPAESARSH